MFAAHAYGAAHDNAAAATVPPLQNAMLVVTLDLESTGMHALYDNIIELCASATLFDASREPRVAIACKRFHTLIRPLRRVGWGARAVHGISDAELAVAPRCGQELRRFNEWLSETAGESCNTVVYAAHGGFTFDYIMLVAEADRFSLHPRDIFVLPGRSDGSVLFVDTLLSWRRERLFGEAAGPATGPATGPAASPSATRKSLSYRLGDIYEREFNAPMPGRAHRASSDVEALERLLLASCRYSAQPLSAALRNARSLSGVIEAFESRPRRVAERTSRISPVAAIDAPREFSEAGDLSRRLAIWLADRPAPTFSAAGASASTTTTTSEAAASAAEPSAASDEARAAQNSVSPYFVK